MFNQTILVVDDDPVNLKILETILKNDYIVELAKNASEAIAYTKKRSLPDLILLDVILPDYNGFDLCKQLKKDKELSSIPIIFITGIQDITQEAYGLSIGAVDYISKPVSPPIVSARVKSHLLLAAKEKNYERIIHERNAEIKRNQEAALTMLGEAGHYNDNDTGVHIWRMSEYSKAIALELQWPIEKANQLKEAAALHDTGKIGIPDSILRAPRALTKEEWVIMKTHTTIGYSILSKSDTPLFNLAATIALNHHEKWDGTGYPNGLKGEKIPIEARIVAIADVFDALSMKRSYKKQWNIDKCIELIIDEKGKHFDPNIVDSFLRILEKIKKIQIAYNKELTDI